jgi:hypothetical protein
MNDDDDDDDDLPATTTAAAAAAAASSLLLLFGGLMLLIDDDDVDVNERRWRIPYRRRDLDNPPAIDFIAVEEGFVLESSTGIIITTVVVVRQCATEILRSEESGSFGALIPTWWKGTHTQ